MRRFAALPLILGSVLATSAFADPAVVARNDAQPAPSGHVASAAQKPENPEAAAALAIAMRHQQEQDRRVAEGLCRAGDHAKCEALKSMGAAPSQ